jgi:mRNA-degrading endonuclease RelE of RelBE toxin-antitoxin system
MPPERAAPLYEVRFSRKAEQYINDLQKKDAKIIAGVLQRLTRAPREGAEKLKQNPSFWRVRAGNHRVVYLVLEDRKMIIVALVRDRKDAYRDLDKLDPTALIRTFAATLASNRIR